MHTGGDDDSAATPVGDDSAQVEHVAAIGDGQVKLIQRVCMLFHGLYSPVSTDSWARRLALSTHAAVGGDGIASLQQDHIAGDQLLGG